MNRALRIFAITAAMLMPAPAWAHAHLKRSSPAAGAQLATSPQIIRLWFSEQPELSMTFASLQDSLGKTFALGSTERDGSGQMGIALKVRSVLSPGRYTVSWRTAASDGHPSSGKFTFVVLERTTQPAGVEPAQAARGPDSSGAESSAAPAVVPRVENADDVDAASSIGNSIARGFLFLGLLALVGAISFKLFVLRGARIARIEVKQRMSQRAAGLGVLSAAVVIVVGLVRLYLESQMMSAMPNMPGMKGMGLADMVMHTDWGFAYRIQVVAAVTALIGFALTLRRLRGGWFIAAAAGLVLAITPALGGHAAASPRLTSLMIAADWLQSSAEPRGLEVCSA